MKRVALVAMSGVRIVNPRLKEAGLTLPGFVERGKVIASLPSLGMLTLAGALPPGWSVDYHEIDALPDSLNFLGAPDLVAISSLTARIDDAYRLAAEIRALGIPVVLGGLHVSAKPEEASQYADAIVCGEGEAVWPMLLSDFERGAMRTRYDSRDPEFANFDWERVPLPRYDLLDPSRHHRVTLQTTRGCPLDCAFCGASRLISPYRKKSMGRIEAELNSIREHWSSPFLELADDNTFVDKRWGLDLAHLIGRFGFRWFTETDISIAESPDLLKALADSGCAQLLIGLESPTPPALAETDSKGWKQRRCEQLNVKIDRIQAAGISVNGCFVVGFDAHGPEIFEDLRDFIFQSPLTEVQLTVLTPFPGTALAAKLQNEGRLLFERYWDRCTLFDVVYRPKRMKVEQLEKGFEQLIREVYSEEASRDRKTRRTRLLRQTLASIEEKIVK